ncbi:MAG: amidohydrolase family protein [Chloroflexi bacterium]|nr:amidohydrolase family protein [Chloroflexota bacterium]
MTEVPTLKIDGARYIVTMDSDRRIVADGSVVITGTRISQVGKSADLASIAADRTIDGTGMVLTPGFVNGHMHISYAHAARGLFPDDLGAEYLPNVFRLQAAMTADDEYATSMLAITELLKYGTTTFIDPGTTTHLGQCLAAYDQAGCRIVVGRNVQDRPNPLNLPVYGTDEAIEATEEAIALAESANSDLVSGWSMPFAAEFCTPELLAACDRIASDHETRSTLHFNNGPRWVEECRRTHGCSPTEYLDRCGVLNPRMTLAHCLGIDTDEARLIADRGSAVVMCPTAAVKGGAGTSANGLLPELLEFGATVGLGTDAGNNSNLLETLRSVYLAAVLYKDGRRDVGMIPAETALELGTIGGAAALGMDHLTGSIEPGKAADLVLFDTRRAEWGALHNPVNSLVYNADGRSVHTVIVDGKVVVADHRPLFVDEASLVEEVQGRGEALLKRTSVAFPPRWPIV